MPMPPQQQHQNNNKHNTSYKNNTPPHHTGISSECPHPRKADDEKDTKKRKRKRNTRRSYFSMGRVRQLCGKQGSSEMYILRCIYSLMILVGQSSK